MKHLLFFLLAFPFLASAQILEKQFVATVQYNGFTQINDSLYRGDLIEFRDVLIEGYQPSGVDSGFICLDGTGRAYRVEVVNSFDYSSLNVDLIELDDYDEIPVGVGIVAERYGSTYQIPNGLVNSIGISSVLQAKILNHNTKIAASDEDRDSTNELQNLVLIGTVLNITDGNAVDFASLFANYLLKADTAAMLDPYIQGAGIVNRMAKFSAARVLTSGNLSDDGTRLAALSPFQLAAYDLVSLPTGVTKDMYWVNTQGPAWYQGARLAYVPESSTSRGTSTYVPHYNSNGQFTENANFRFDGRVRAPFGYNSASYGFVGDNNRYIEGRSNGMLLNGVSGDAIYINVGSGRLTPQSNLATSLGSFNEVWQRLFVATIRARLPSGSAATPSYVFDDGSGNVINAGMYGTGNQTNNNLGFSTKATAEATATNKLWINADGKIGIPTTSPQRTLHVVGEVRITDLTTDTPTRIVGADADGDLGDVTWLVPLSNALGVGATPTQDLDVHGDGLVRDTIFNTNPATHSTIDGFATWKSTAQGYALGRATFGSGLSFSGGVLSATGSADGNGIYSGSATLSQYTTRALIPSTGNLLFSQRYNSNADSAYIQFINNLDGNREIRGGLTDTASTGYSTFRFYQDEGDEEMGYDLRSLDNSGNTRVLAQGGSLRLIGSGIATLESSGEVRLLGLVKAKQEAYNEITSTSSPQTLSNTYSDNLINQGGTQATFTLNMPASPDDGQVCTITFNNAISTLTIDGNGETIVGSAVVTGVPGSQRKFKFYSGIGWIKLY